MRVAKCCLKFGWNVSESATSGREPNNPVRDEKKSGSRLIAGIYIVCSDQRQEVENAPRSVPSPDPRGRYM